MSGTLRERAPIAAAGALLAAAFLQQILATRATSAVVDEPAHLTAGYLSIARGDLSVNREHPPLLKAIAALPLLAIDPTLPPVDPAGPAPGSEDFEFDYSRKFLYHANDAGRLLGAARVPMMILTLLLGVLVFAWTRAITGPTPALVATALYAFEPNILGHGRLVTTDLGSAAFCLAFLWALRRFTRSGSVGSAAACGILLGAALLSKFSTLLLLPLGAVLVVLDRLQGGPEIVGSGVLRRRLPGLVALVLCFRPEPVTPVRTDVHPRTVAADSEPAHNLRATLGGATILLIAWLVLEAGYLFGGFPLPRLYLDGFALAALKNQTVEGPTYLMGSISPDGFWIYYLVALIIKTPIPLLVLGAWGAIAGLADARLRREAAWILVPAAAWIAAMTILTRAQIGFRYVMPVTPLLCIAAGIGAASLLALKARKTAVVVLAALILWQAASAVWIHPHHLAYFNEIAGGPARGWRWLVDSNLDWGQDLVGLRQWQESHGDPPVNLFYFGTADPDYHRIRRHPYGAAQPGWFAISATHLAGVYLPDPDYLASFREMTPSARIGWSILVYRLDEVPDRLRRPLVRP